MSRNHPLSREHLLQATRVHEDVFDRSIDVQILRLRRKLERDPSVPRVIQTVCVCGFGGAGLTVVLADLAPRRKAQGSLSVAVTLQFRPDVHAEMQIQDRAQQRGD